MEGGERNAHKLRAARGGENHGENEMRWQSVQSMSHSLYTGISTALYWSYPECTVVSCKARRELPNHPTLSTALLRFENLQVCTRPARATGHRTVARHGPLRTSTSPSTSTRTSTSTSTSASTSGAGLFRFRAR